MTLCLFSIYYKYFWGGYLDSISSFVNRKRVRQRTFGQLGLCCTSLLSHGMRRRLRDHHLRPHTHSHGTAKWVQLTDTHLMSGRLDLGWLMRERLTDSGGQWKDESETWETYGPHAPGPRLPPFLPSGTWRSSDPRRSANNHQLTAAWTCVPSLTQTHGPLEARHPFSLVPRRSRLTLNWACAKLINSHTALAITSSLWYHASVS